MVSLHEIDNDSAQEHPRVCRRLQLQRDGGRYERAATNRYSPEVRESAVRMVLGHERDLPSRWGGGGAMVSMAEKIGWTA